MYWTRGWAAGSVFIWLAEEVVGFVDVADDAGVVDRDALDRILREQGRCTAVAAAASQRRQVGGAEHHWMAALAAVLRHHDQLGSRAGAIGRGNPCPDRGACQP